METSLSSVGANPQKLSNLSAPDSNPEDFVIQFWGVRGSIPTPGKETIRYGGNTSCLEMRVAGKRLIFDGGTGLRLLGDDLLKEAPVEAYMFLPTTTGIIFKDFPCLPRLLCGVIAFIFMGNSAGWGLDETTFYRPNFAS